MRAETSLNAGGGRSSRIEWPAAAVLLLLVLALIGASSVAALPLPQGGRAALFSATVVRFAPSPVQIGWGGVRNVDIQVDNVVGLYAAQVRVAFPSANTQVVDADPGLSGVQILDGTLMAGPGQEMYTILNDANNTTGVLEYIVALTGASSAVTGSGVLATIPLTSLAVGSARMSFVEVILCQQSGGTITVQLADGGGADVVVSSETWTPTSTPLGLPTATPSSTPLVSATPTPSVNPSIPASVTSTHTPTLVPSETPTPTQTRTPTSTYTPGPSPTDLPPAHVSVTPDALLLAEGDTNIIQIRIDSAYDLYGFSVRLDYNGTVLDIDDAESGTPGVQVYMGDVYDGFGGAYQIAQNEVYDDGIFGQIRFAAYLNGGFPLGFAGNGVMLWFVVRGAAPGLSYLTLSEVTLVSHAGLTLTRTLAHGQVTVLAEGVTPSATLTPSATSEGTATTTPTPSVTETPTLGPTPTETVSPSATQTNVLVTPTAVCGNRLQNGGFETVVGGDAAPWVRTASVTYTNLEWHQGARSAWLGGRNNANDRLYQQIAIPGDTSLLQGVIHAATLSYWWGIVTNEVSHPFDHLYVRVRDTSDVLLEELEVLTDADASETWQESEFDLTAYKGQTVRISFEAVTDASNSTSFFVDDVELDVCEIIQPTATATATATATPSPTATITATPSQTLVATLTPTASPTPIIVTFRWTEGGYQACYDSWLDSWHPDTNYGPYSSMTIRSANAKRPVLYFDVSSIPSGVTIMDARLWLLTDSYRSHTQTINVSAYGLKRGWVEREVTWNRVQTGTNWTLAGADSIVSDRDEIATSSRTMLNVATWYDWDVTALVQDWVSGTRSNNGLILIPTGNTNEMHFWSSASQVPSYRPRLEVKYYWGGGPGVTSTPGGPTPTPTRTSTPVPGAPELVLQQGLSGYSGVTDTYLSEWQPTTNYGANTKVAVRYGGVRPGLVRFDLASVPAGITVQEAYIEMYAVDRSNVGQMTIGVTRVLRSWSEAAANWTKATASTNWAVAGCKLAGSDLAAAPESSTVVNAVGQWHSWVVTDLVRAWLAGSAANYGVVFTGSGQTTVEYDYFSSEYIWDSALTPRLVIRYTP
jgi:hypothetical protein